MKLFIKYALTISIFTVAISYFVGCKEEDEDKLPKVVAGFTHTINEDTGTVTFINISTNATKYLWDFGDAETSKEIDPVKTYMSGTYIVTLTASNVAGATDVFKDTLNIAIRGIISIPATFDDSNVNYKATAFDGTSFEIVDNPDQSGTNDKATKVGAITNSGAAFEGIFFDLGTQLDLTTNKRITMNFWSDAAVAVLLKLEKGTAAAVEKSITHGGTGWESLSFDFNSSAKYSRFTLFVDGPGTKAGTFFMDDIIQEETPPEEVVCIAETTENIDPASGDINWTFKTNDLDHTFEAFGNTEGSIVANPVFDGINTSCSVEKFTKKIGCETFAGLGTELATALDFSIVTKKVFKMKVLAETQVTDVTLRLERLPFPDVDPAQDRVASITQVGIWEELTFDFSDVSSGTFKSMIIYFERNATCDGDVYYFDDIKQVASTGGDTTPPVITLLGGATVDLIAGDCFMDAGSTASDNVDGDISGNIVVGGDAVDGSTAGTFLVTYNVSDAAGNAASQVTRTVIVTRFDDGLLVNGDFQDGANPWIIGVGTDPAPVATVNCNTYYSVDVTSPTPGSPFTVNVSQKLEIISDETYTLAFDAWSDRSRTIKAGIGLSGGSFANTADVVTITTTRQTFSLTLTATGFGAPDARVLFDLAEEAGIVNIDNVSLVAGSGGGGGPSGNLAANGDFETGDATGWDLFQNGGTAILDNTTSNGGTWSGKLATSGPSNPAFKQERIGAGTVAAGDVVEIKFDHKGTVVQPGAVFNVILFGEGAGGASFTKVFSPPPVLGASYTTFTDTFTIPGGTDVSEGISFLIEAVCGGDAGCSVSANIDNVSVTLNP